VGWVGFQDFVAAPAGVRYDAMSRCCRDDVAPNASRAAVHADGPKAREVAEGVFGARCTAVEFAMTVTRARFDCLSSRRVSDLVHITSVGLMSVFESVLLLVQDLAIAASQRRLP